MACLEKYREQVMACDRQLMDILKKRMEVCAQIGEFKKEQNMAVVQTVRFNELMDIWANEAVMHGLNKDFACKMFQAIHDESVRIQQEIIKGER